jgi:peptidoglycan/xylan/chitin deacetylase (PgdA/CDA1 family)
MLKIKPLRSKRSVVAAGPLHGAFVVSLDFELYWGVFDLYKPPSPYNENVLGARVVVPQLLKLFEDFQISATWATVGMLFASNYAQAKHFYPDRLPSYRNPHLSPYSREHQQCEPEERFYYARDLVWKIAACPGQEIGTHTFSHYYCLEPSQCIDEFEADLLAARRMADQHKLTLRSIVFPRNQVNRKYLSVLAKHGIWAYRGNEVGWMYRSGPRREQARATRRIARLADAYVNASGDNTVGWQELIEPDGLCNVRASRYLRPFAPSLRVFERERLRRVIGGIEAAAQSGRLFHLWLHPEDMGRNIAENLDCLRVVLETFRKCRTKYGMRSMCMREVAEAIGMLQQSS